MNFSDLFVVLGLGSALYAVIVALTGQRQFLSRAVNPYRGTWLIAGASIFWVGLSLMRWEAGSWDLKRWWPMFGDLVSEAPTAPRVKVASMALFLAGILIFLVGWCMATLPRDPSTFRRPQDRRAAFRYYVTRLRGGLDFALLAWGTGDRLEEEASVKHIESWCQHLPRIACDNGDPPRIRTANDQIRDWREVATRIHERMKDLDEVIRVSNQGHNRRIVFDAEFGGLFFRYLRQPDPRSSVDTSLYLFAATLNQAAMDNQTAEQHFRLLLEALNNIERAIRIN